MDAWKEYFLKEVQKNDWQDLAMAAGVFAISLLGLFLLKKISGTRLRAWSARSANRWDDIFFRAFARTQKWFLFLLSGLFAFEMLKFSASTEKFLRGAAFAGFLLQTALWGSALISGYLQYYRRMRLASDAESVTTVGVLGFLAKLAFFSVLLVIGFENFGINVSALVTGMGIGGIAVALAAQNVLGDLFASVAIALDKPFAIGDFVVLDSLRGNVERIGMKTTHIRSLDGELIVLPNSHMVNNRLHNFKRMQERRVQLSLGVIYETPLELLRQIPEMLRAAIEGQSKTRFDRAHFSAFADSALQFEIVFFILSPDYQVYMDVQQAILFAIQERFLKEGISFAYPTQTIVLSASGHNEGNTIQ